MNHNNVKLFFVVTFILFLPLKVSAGYNETDSSFISTHVMTASTATGIGNRAAPLLYLRFSIKKGLADCKLKDIVFSLDNAITEQVLQNIQLFATQNNYGLHTRMEIPVLLANMKIKPGQKSFQNLKLHLFSPYPLHKGENYIWLAADISPQAKEGLFIHPKIKGYYIIKSNNEKASFLKELKGKPKCGTQIFLTEGIVTSPGDMGSHFWRIPAITTTKNGRLVAVMDKRGASNTDMPNNIDVATSYSDNMGKTWSIPYTIAGTFERGGDYCHGDPSILYNQNNGDILVLVTSKVVFSESTNKERSIVKKIVSHDNGTTWDKPVDITNQIYGFGCADKYTQNWEGLFVSSGAISQTNSGRIQVILNVRETKGNTLTNFILYSDDNGQTWHVNHSPIDKIGNEAKSVELADGNILVSVRHRKARILNTGSRQTDGSVLFGKEKICSELIEPGCNGDMIRYTLKNNGHSANRLLHSIAYDSTTRKNVSILLSYDEGKTWGSNPYKKFKAQKVIAPLGSAYSALTILSDETIGCFYEDSAIPEKHQHGCTLRFVRFSLNWLTDGEDSEP